MRLLNVLLIITLSLLVQYISNNLSYVNPRPPPSPILFLMKDRCIGFNANPIQLHISLIFPIACVALALVLSLSILYSRLDVKYIPFDTNLNLVQKIASNSPPPVWPQMFLICLALVLTSDADQIYFCLLAIPNNIFCKAFHVVLEPCRQALLGNRLTLSRILYFSIMLYILSTSTCPQGELICIFLLSFCPTGHQPCGAAEKGLGRPFDLEAFRSIMEYIKT